MKSILNKIKINPITYILLLLSLLSGYIKTMLIITIIIFIHELGHITFFIIYKIPIEKIEFYPFGGLTIVNKRIHERIYKDLITSLAGIFFQIVLIILITIIYHNNLLHITTYELFIKYNKLIIIFNLIPIIPLDGSKFINTILNKYLPYNKSYQITYIISIIALIIFVIYNTIFKINDLIIYIFFIIQLISFIKLYNHNMNKFYLERVIYPHYYDKIINNHQTINNLKLNKYYYFYKNNHYINEKDYINSKYFKK